MGSEIEIKFKEKKNIKFQLLKEQFIFQMNDGGVRILWLLNSMRISSGHCST